MADEYTIQPSPVVDPYNKDRIPPATYIPQDADSISGFTEEAQDAVGAMVDSTLVYNDATPQLSRAALTGDVTAPQGSNATTLVETANVTSVVQAIIGPKVSSLTVTAAEVLTQTDYNALSPPHPTTIYFVLQ